MGMIKCRWCDEVYASYSGLSKHVATSHVREWTIWLTEPDSEKLEQAALKAHDTANVLLLKIVTTYLHRQQEQNEAR
jgi:uncharacterized C2H2 Zn-finger protein